MKINISFLTGLCLGLQVIGVLSAAIAGTANTGLSREDPAIHSALATECGNLGVMAVPEGANAADVRHCADHPLHHNRDIDFTDADVKLARADLESEERAVADLDIEDEFVDAKDNSPAAIFGRGAQACNKGPPYGCARHYCWRECGGRGEWCWIAEGNGSGPWRRCTYDWDCRPQTGGSCGVGCGSCGCSC